MRTSALVATVLAAGSALAQRGVPQGGFPSWEERMIWVYTNRARADPQADLAGCSECGERACYTPKPPTSYSLALNRAARFHSANLTRTGRFQHDSPCTLVADLAARYPPNGPCDGSASCACVGGSAACNPTCTPFFQRVQRFGATAAAENIAGGFATPRQAFYAWLHERDSNTACGFRGANGHRYSILTSGPALGVGFDGNWTQDFGGGPAPAGTLIAGGHEPRAGGGTVDFRVSYFDARGAPQSSQLNVDGTCTAMSRERGDATHATYLAQLSLTGTACRRYQFVFRDPAGATVLLPETGSYGVGPVASCPDWTASAPPGCAGGGGPSGSIDVRLVAPEPAATVQGTIEVVAEATSTLGIEKVQFELDGVVFAEAGNSPYRVSLDTRSVEPGFRTLHALALAPGGVSARSSPVSVTVAQQRGCGCGAMAAAPWLGAIALLALRRRHHRHAV